MRRPARMQAPGRVEARTPLANDRMDSPANTLPHLPQTLPVLLNGGPETVKALCFTVNPAHEQYVGTLPLAEQARIIKAAHGQSGPNLDYALSTLRHLQALYIQDTEMVALGGALGEVVT